MPIVALPSSAEMLRRLMAVDPNPHLEEQLYRRLMSFAGCRTESSAVAILLATLITTYVTYSNGVTQAYLVSLAPKFIEALLAHPDATTEAKEFFPAALRMVS